MLDSVAAAVWRASWQAAALALIVGLLVRCFGERLAPRWRYLLWSVVVLRLLFVATPSSPWSAFNFVGWNPQLHARQVVTHEVDGRYRATPTRSRRQQTIRPAGTEQNRDHPT
ncbi:MAG TPA: M56 family metallopeptidase [Planctomycetaceae bacterium]